MLHFGNFVYHLMKDKSNCTHRGLKIMQVKIEIQTSDENIAGEPKVNVDLKSLNWAAMEKEITCFK